MTGNAQKQNNENARKVKAKINVFNGWRVTDKDGNEYYARKISDVYAILAELEGKNNETESSN